MNARDMDRKKLMDMPKEELVDLMFMHIRDLWAVDGLYFLGIEERFGTEGATEIDRKVWDVMGKIEARRLKETLEIHGNDVQAMITALSVSSWALDLEDREIELEKDRAKIRNTNCRTQKTRLKKGLDEFPCRMVRWDYLKAFAREFNEDIVVECRVCPPGKHPEDLWCEWEFKMRE
jgi:hypothetical protein